MTLIFLNGKYIIYIYIYIYTCFTFDTENAGLIMRLARFHGSPFNVINPS